MFQSFSGNSRRPRQVNLSGQNLNPFAASSWAPTATGTQKTVAAAQQERLQRQQERDRLNATKRIQRTWRGHRTRSVLAQERRQQWDELEDARQHGSGHPPQVLAELLQLLLSFYSRNDSGDVQRLYGLVDQLLGGISEAKVSILDFRPYFPRLCRLLLSTLGSDGNVLHKSALQILALIVGSDAGVATKHIAQYYGLMATLVREDRINLDAKETFINALQAPLAVDSSVAGNESELLTRYLTFATHFLSLPNLSQKSNLLTNIATFTDIDLLATAFLQDNSISILTTMVPENRLWLLAHYIEIQKRKRGAKQDPVYLKTLSMLLTMSLNEIVGRMEARESNDALDNEGDSANSAVSVSLPAFIKDEITSLVNKASITDLLSNFSSSSSNSGDASLLATYVLVLLRIFPTLGEEIRMWLYQGSVSTSADGSQIPAIKVFWQVMSATKIFLSICNDTTSTLTILQSYLQRRGSYSSTQKLAECDREWRAILLFLELYAFVLRFTDDEEFLAGDTPILSDPSRPLSRSQESALPISDVKLLTTFLKNLSFTMYYNAAELKGTNSRTSDSGLISYLGAGSSSMFSTAQPPRPVEFESQRAQDLIQIAGINLDDFKAVINRVMKMLYERDSRRRFLPRNHWLMTSRFEMEGFIPAVVMEEERRREISAEGGDIDSDSDHDIEFPGLIGMRQARRSRYLEQLSRRQEKAKRKSILAAVGPRLEILQNMPYVVPFKTRVQIFRQFVHEDQVRRRNGYVDPDEWRMGMIHGRPFAAGTDPRDILAKHHAKIRRNHIFDDALQQFYPLGEGLKEPIQITFVDKFDTVEAGIDGGGVTKEFLTSVTNEAFRGEDGPLNLFVANDQNLLYPNPTSLEQAREFLTENNVVPTDQEWAINMNELVKQYEFLGRIVGKCLYEGILVDISFAGFFLLKWASSDSLGSSSKESRYLPNINDLRDLDESLYQGLLQLKNYPGNVEDFSLDFTITDAVTLPHRPPRIITRNLIPDGSNIAVTNENRVLYVSAVARYRLHSQSFVQTRAFLRGLGQIIKPSWLSMFNQSELQTLIGGDAAEIDIDDLRRNTNYSGLYVVGDDGLEHPTVQLFWQVMRDLDDADRRKVLRYVTSTPRSPLLGFAQLNPKFSIRDAGTDEQRLPSTSTCINLLKLPRYTTSDTLASKLLYAVNSGAGFDLS